MTSREDHDKHPSVIAFAARAAALVAAADPAAVAAVLADFPEAGEIGLRDDPASFNPHRKPPPKDPAERAEYLREQIERPRKAVDCASRNTPAIDTRAWRPCVTPTSTFPRAQTRSGRDAPSCV